MQKLVLDAQGQISAALLKAKIAAVWRWADTVADGDLGCTELQRLADRVDMSYANVCGALGLDSETLELRIARDAFVTRSPQAVEGWFDKLELELEGSRGCLASLPCGSSCCCGSNSV